MTLIRQFTPARQIFFEGNSLMNNIANANTAGGHYVSVTAYNTIIATPKTVMGFHYAIGGQNQAQINSAFSTRISPYLRANDIYVIWEGLNDLRGGLTAAQAYANLVTCIANIKGLGGKVVVGTVAKSDFTGDAADLPTRVDTYNASVLANTDVDAIANIGADSHFDQLADASNATYYLADKIHLATTGQNLAASIISTAVLTLL
jgi:hypothetical protein